MLEKRQIVQDINVQVGRFIKEARTSKGMSQMELARKIDVSYQQVQKYEKGISNISLFRLEQIAKALNVPVKSFLCNGEEEISREEVELILLFRRIKNRDLKGRLFTMLEALSKGKVST
jgi:transcriptional regulator with XRE-family HTH domain